MKDKPGKVAVSDIGVLLRTVGQSCTDEELHTIVTKASEEGTFIFEVSDSQSGNFIWTGTINYSQSLKPKKQKIFYSRPKNRCVCIIMTVYRVNSVDVIILEHEKSQFVDSQ